MYPHKHTSRHTHLQHTRVCTHPRTRAHMEALKCLCLNPSPKGLKRPFRGRRLSLVTSKRLRRHQESQTGWLALQALAMTLQNDGEEGTGQTRMRGFAGATEPWGAPRHLPPLRSPPRKSSALLCSPPGVCLRRHAQPHS